MSTPADLFSLAVLDMNGTTVEDTGIFQRSLLHAFAAVNMPVPGDDVIAPLRGMAKIEMFRQLIPQAETAVLAHQEFNAAFLRAIADGAIRPVTGTADVLKELRRRRLSVCLVTGFSPTLQHAIIDKLQWTDLIDLSVSSDEVPNGRPHPDMIQHAAERLGVNDPRQVVVVGDTPNDLIAGQRADAGLVVGVLTGPHPAETLREISGTHLISDITHLPHLLTSFAPTPGGAG